MILYSPVDVKQLCKSGKDYPWQKPDRCPRCRGPRLWGHGFVTRYLEPVGSHLWIKRYRCPDCRSVHTFRPYGYLPIFRYPLRIILTSLYIKATTSGWAKELSRQIQQAWWRSLRRAASRHVNLAAMDVGGLVAGLLFRFMLRDVLLL